MRLPITVQVLPLILLLLKVDPAHSTSNVGLPNSLSAILHSPTLFPPSRLTPRQTGGDISFELPTAKTPGFDYANPRSLLAASPSCAQPCLAIWWTEFYCSKKDTITTDFHCLCKPVPPSQYDFTLEVAEKFGVCVNEKCDDMADVAKMQNMLMEATADCSTYPELAKGVPKDGGSLKPQDITSDDTTDDTPDLDSMAVAGSGVSKLLGLLVGISTLAVVELGGLRLVGALV